MNRCVCLFLFAVVALLTMAILISHSAMAQVTGVSTPPGSGQVLNLGTQGNVYMTIDTSGKIGIGATTLPYTLTVAPGGPGSGLGISWNKLTGGTGETDFYNYAQGGSGGFAFYNYPAPGTNYPTSGATNLMTIGASGNVGIGTPTPVRKLNIAGAGLGAVDISLTDTTQGADLKSFVIDNRNQTFNIGTDNDAGNNFGSLLTITRTGNVGIGTTNPAFAKLQINVGTNQDLWLRTLTSDPALSFANDSGSAYVPGMIDASPLIINTNSGGNVGIGITNPAQKLSVAGIIQSTSGGVKFPDGTVQTTAAAAPPGGRQWGGMYVFDAGPATCPAPNPYTGGCSCPPGFTASGGGITAQSTGQNWSTTFCTK